MDQLSYQIEKAAIEVDRMQFKVENRNPKYSLKDKETVKAEIEKQLFAVFCEEKD